MTATARLAEFVVKTTLRECPDGAIPQVRRAAPDPLGVMLAGAAEPAAASVRVVVRAEGSTPLCTVVGTSLRTAPTWAALANGTAGHAHDFDDTNFALMGHPSAPLLAAALAAGQAEMAAGHAARNGVFAAMLAREGFTASDAALDGTQGYANAFSQAKLAVGTFDELGSRWQILASGIAVKPYPSCALTHSAIDALLALRT